MSSRKRSACSSITVKSSRASALEGGVLDVRAIDAEPLIAVRGVFSSWLTSPRNSLRVRSSTSSMRCVDDVLRGLWGDDQFLLAVLGFQQHALVVSLDTLIRSARVAAIEATF